MTNSKWRLEIACLEMSAISMLVMKVVLQEVMGVVVK